jgi:hypothetical protein
MFWLAKKRSLLKRLPPRPKTEDSNLAQVQYLATQLQQMYDWSKRYDHLGTDSIILSASLVDQLNHAHVDNVQ